MHAARHSLTRHSLRACTLRAPLRPAAALATAAVAVTTQVRLTGAAHEIWEHYLPVGGFAVDATVGNGLDTLWLARRVGRQGRVLGFDIQASAVQSEAVSITQGLLEDEVPAGSMPQLQLLCACHSTVKEHVWQPAVDLVCYNTGFLPGSGRPEVITSAESTVASLAAAAEVLKPGGLISVLAYHGHAGGREELDAVAAFGAGLDRRWQVSQCQILNHPTAPYLILFYKKKGFD